MADLIDRDALEPFYESGTDPTDPYSDMTFIRAEHIENAPAVNRMIPCSERLPELNEVNQSECVLVCALNDNWFGMAYFLGNGWAFADAQTKPRLDAVEVTHWMPLPNTEGLT